MVGAVLIDTFTMLPSVFVTAVTVPWAYVHELAINIDAI